MVLAPPLPFIKHRLLRYHRPRRVWKRMRFATSVPCEWRLPCVGRTHTHFFFFIVRGVLCSNLYFLLWPVFCRTCVCGC